VRIPSPEVARSIIVPIETLEPEPYELVRPVHVVVQPEEDSYVATFFDANVNASGETQQDAVANLKDMLVTLFERLEKEPRTNLGKGPALQLAVLRSILRRKPTDAAHHQGARPKNRTQARRPNRQKRQGP
jgi:predicted RNase H-like HicB family nuclease